MASLTDSQKTVLRGTISPARVEELRAEVTADLAQENLRQWMDMVGQYERRDVYRAEYRYGFRSRMFKGPFVEVSSWVPLRSFQIVGALERYIQTRLGSTLEERTWEEDAGSSWEDVDGFFRDAAQRLRADGSNPDVLVLQGELPTWLSDDLWRLFDHVPAHLRGRTLDPGMAGHLSIRGSPLLLNQDPSLSPAAYVLDLDEFRYVQTNPDVMDSSDLLFRVDPINWEQAAESIDADTSILSWVGKSLNLDRVLGRDEGVVLLQLFVVLHVIAAATIQDLSPRTVGQRLLLADTKS
jgi:hypothetical protein